MTDLITERLIERRGPGRIDGGEPQPIDPPSVFPDGVELARLIARAQLTLAQALELSVGVLAEAVRRWQPEAGNAGGDRAMAGPIVIGADGRVVPPRPADIGRDGRPPSARPGDGATVGSVLADIAGSVRPRARHAGPAAEQLLAELDGAAAELPVAGVPAVARRLRELAAAIDRRAVRAELGALVRAIGTGAGTTSGTPPAVSWSAPNRASAAGPAAAGRGGTGRRGTGRRRIGAWLLSVLLLGGAVLLEVVFLRDHIASDIGLLLDSGRGGSTASASASPTPAGVRVAAPAPPSAGNVTAVDLRALAPCAPGSPCTVRLQVLLAPRAGQQAVTWSYRITDRCTGAAHAAPGGGVSVPAGATRAEVVATVPLPAAHGVALTAVTGKPAAAASQPVLIGSCPAHP